MGKDMGRGKIIGAERPDSGHNASSHKALQAGCLGCGARCLECHWQGWMSFFIGSSLVRMCEGELCSDLFW